MQATVSSYDPDRRSGTLRCDDGTELSYDADALARGSLRMLRTGQRVFVLLTDSGSVQAVSIWT